MRDKAIITSRDSTFYNMIGSVTRVYHDRSASITFNASFPNIVFQPEEYEILDKTKVIDKISNMYLEIQELTKARSALKELLNDPEFR